LDDDADKDEDERKLESLLFGKPFVSASGRRHEVTAIEDVEEGYGGADVASAELEGMLDSDVSYRLVLRR
jgi:U3 small nucleolar RNA-associated protein 18